jgi:hypothetical protein
MKSLYELHKKNPGLDLQVGLKNVSSAFKRYIMDSLAKLEEAESNTNDENIILSSSLLNKNRGSFGVTSRSNADTRDYRLSFGNGRDMNLRKSFSGDNVMSATKRSQTPTPMTVSSQMTPSSFKRSITPTPSSSNDSLRPVIHSNEVIKPTVVGQANEGGLCSAVCLCVVCNVRFHQDRKQ